MNDSIRNSLVIVDQIEALARKPSGISVSSNSHHSVELLERNVPVSFERAELVEKGKLLTTSAN